MHRSYAYYNTGTDAWHTRRTYRVHVKQERASRSGSRNRREISFRHRPTRSTSLIQVPFARDICINVLTCKSRVSSLRHTTSGKDSDSGSLTNNPLPSPFPSHLPSPYRRPTPTSRPRPVHLSALSPKLRVKVPAGKRDSTQSRSRNPN